MPVIELQATDYTDREFEWPKGSRDELPEAWEALWQKALADSGIYNLKSIRPGYGFSRLSEISSKTLAIILDVHLQDISTEDKDEISSLCGGLAICTNHEVLLCPQCCTNIYDWKNWGELLENHSRDWTQIWIGHPWIYGRVNGENIEITGYVELNPAELKDENIKYTFNLNEFKTAYEPIAIEISEFRLKIAEVLKEKNLKNRDKIAEILMDGHLDWN